MKARSRPTARSSCTYRAALSLAIEKWGTANEWVSLGIILATGLGVYEAPNVPAPVKPEPAPAAVPDDG